MNATLRESEDFLGALRAHHKGTGPSGQTFNGAAYGRALGWIPLVGGYGPAPRSSGFPNIDDDAAMTVAYVARTMGGFSAPERAEKLWEYLRYDKPNQTLAQAGKALFGHCLGQ
ncbi:MAG: hypothetical protein KJ867_15835 [Gammaproteobacteria bacterium]|nr:hypothetical protein [Gammaproteobacteria bacterium]